MNEWVGRYGWMGEIWEYGGIVDRLTDCLTWSYCCLQALWLAIDSLAPPVCLPLLRVGVALMVWLGLTDSLSVACCPCCCCICFSLSAPQPGECVEVLEAKLAAPSRVEFALIERAVESCKKVDWFRKNSRWFIQVDELCASYRLLEIVFLRRACASGSVDRTGSVEETGICTHCIPRPVRLFLSLQIRTSNLLRFHSQGLLLCRAQMVHPEIHSFMCVSPCNNVFVTVRIKLISRENDKRLVLQTDLVSLRR